jgi:hypothetical protein
MKENMKTAVISQCLKFRYELGRSFVEAPNNPAIFCMLNPSTADSMIDDPTIRRCIQFAKDNGHDSLKVVNLYAFRSPTPKSLWLTDDPVGIDNDAYLMNLFSKHKRIICAWGGNAKMERVVEVYDMLNKLGVEMYCLGTTKAGMPKHPLYIKGDQPFIEFKLGQQNEINK